MTLGPTIIFIIVAAIAGYILGILDSRVTTALRKKSEEPLPPVEPAEGDIARSGERAVLKLSVDDNQEWRIDLDGIRLDVPDAISAEQRQRLVNTLVQMRPWLDAKPAAGSTIMPTPPPAVSIPAVERLSAKSADSHPATPAPFKINLMKGINSMVSKEVKSPSDLKPPSIVAMIDDVLQAKLSGTHLQERGIKLEDGLLGEVIVCVGSQRYVGVVSVPDPEIREMIQSAISDWEKR